VTPMLIEIENGSDPLASDPHRRTGDDYLGRRIARLAWFELAAAATRRAILTELRGETPGNRTPA